MEHQILVLDEGVDLAFLSRENGQQFDEVICLFWAAKETEESVSLVFGCECVSLRAVAPDVMAVEEDASEFVRKLCACGPVYQGIPLREYLAGYLYGEVLRIRMYFAVVAFLERLARARHWDAVNVVYSLGADNAVLLSAVLAAHAVAPEIVMTTRIATPYSDVAPTSRPAFPKRMIREFRRAMATGHWMIHVWNAVEKTDPSFRLRRLLSKFSKPALRGKGGITAFSSYLNNSRALMPFEKIMATAPHWVVSTYYARQAVRGPGRRVDWLWQFDGGQRGTVPVDTLDRCFSPSTPSEEATFAVWRAVSRFRLNWTGEGLSSLLVMTGQWEAYLKKAEPRLVAVANQWGIEGWFSRIARLRGIPVLQVMHGVMGGHFYTRTPVQSDRLVVSGEFWKRLWPAEEQKKIVVHTPPGTFPAGRPRPARTTKQLTFFSWPLALTPFYNFTEFTDGFISILHHLAASKTWRICVRTHPMENPSHLTRRWKKLHGIIPAGIAIENGKDADLQDTLDNTDVAAMYRSTVMLCCLARKIPVVMPGWVDLGWDPSLLSDKPGIYLARSFRDLEEKLAEWLSSPPSIENDASHVFVRPEGEGAEDLLSFLSARPREGVLPSVFEASSI